jgi:hypothetical protein
MVGVPFNPLQTPKQPEEKPAPVAFDPAGIEKLRAMKAKAPNAAGMSDAQFALAMHQNYYSDIPLADYLPKMGLDRGDVLYELRAPGDPYGDYLRQALAAPGTGETAQAAAVRQGGQVGERRAGNLEGSARAYVQGGMFGWGDEAVAAGAAALDPLVHGDRGKDFGERYDAYLNRERGLVGNFREDNPLAAYGAEIAGAIPTAIAASPASVASTGAGRFATNALVNAGQGAAYGAGAAEGDLTDRAINAGTGAIVSAGGGVVLDGVVGTVQSAFAKGARNKARDAFVDAAPTAAEQKVKAQAAYTAADTSGVLIKPTATSLLKSDLSQFLTSEGLVANGKFVGNFNLAKRAMKHLESFDGRPMTMKELQRVEESFQDVARSTKAGEARIGKMMLDQFDDYVDSLPQQAFSGGNGIEAAANWKAGKQGWAQFKRTKSIEQAVYNAKLSGNFSEGLRGEFRAILKSEKQRSRFSDAELKAMEDFVMGGTAQALLKAFANGGMPGAVLGGLSGGLLGAAAGVVGPAAAKLGLDKGARKAGDALRAQVANGGSLPVPPVAPRALDLRALAPALGNVEERPRDLLEILVTGGAR